MFRFLSPLTIAIASSLLLDESFTRKEAFSGGALPLPHFLTKLTSTFLGQFSALSVSF
jgi:hypothetical protein